MVQIYTEFQTPPKRLKNHTLWDRTYLYGLYIKKYTPSNATAGTDGKRLKFGQFFFKVLKLLESHW